MSTLADQILATDDRPAREVRAWGQHLWIRPISGTERDAYDVERSQAFEAAQDGTVGYWRARYLVRCLFDGPGPDAKRVFSNQQAAALAEKSGETIKRLWDVANAVNESGPGAEAAAGKNS